MTVRPIRLGLISALHQEQADLTQSMKNTKIVTRGMRDYITGKLGEIECVCVLSRIGKVAAAVTATTLIERFDVTHIVFTGVAGGADPLIKVGDIVIADSLVQHDMNAAPLFPRFEIPLTGLSHFASDRNLTDRLAQAANDFIEADFHNKISSSDRTLFKLADPRVHRGLIASGDEFIHKSSRMAVLNAVLPNVLAVEMEGAAVAQVCFELGIPYAVIRTISDGANENSAVDFMQFVESVASQYAYCVIKRFCHSWQSDATSVHV
jgi:adenosylhomocysteine nucleosidase